MKNPSPTLQRLQLPALVILTFCGLFMDFGISLHDPAASPLASLQLFLRLHDIFGAKRRRVTTTARVCQGGVDSGGGSAESEGPGRWIEQFETVPTSQMFHVMLMSCSCHLQNVFCLRFFCFVCAPSAESLKINFCF